MDLGKPASRPGRKPWRGACLWCGKPVALSPDRFGRFCGMACSLPWWKECVRKERAAARSAAAPGIK